MDRDSALQLLPLQYATALRLQATGAGEQLIAAGLGVELDELPLLLQLAEAKLSRLLAGEPAPAPSEEACP